jgi:hypothetical protein
MRINERGFLRTLVNRAEGEGGGEANLRRSKNFERGFLWTSARGAREERGGMNGGKWEAGGEVGEEGLKVEIEDLGTVGPSGSFL